MPARCTFLHLGGMQARSRLQFSADTMIRAKSGIYLYTVYINIYSYRLCTMQYFFALFHTTWVVKGSHTCGCLYVYIVVNYCAYVKKNRLLSLCRLSQCMTKLALIFITYKMCEARMLLFFFYKCLCIAIIQGVPTIVYNANQVKVARLWSVRLSIYTKTKKRVVILYKGMNYPSAKISQ